MWEKFYSKNGLAAKNIAKELMNIKVGEKFPVSQTTVISYPSAGDCAKCAEFIS